MDAESLNKITAFAARAHGTQKRKYSDELYIVHPIRVMEICKEYSEKGSILAAALLHDVLEDTDTTEAEILEFLKTVMGYSAAEKALQYVIELTDVFTHEDYPQWNRDKRKHMETERMAKISADAQTIKYADILDNTPEIMQSDPGFGRKYLREVKNLMDRMTKGDSKLRFRTLKVIRDF